MSDGESLRKRNDPQLGQLGSYASSAQCMARTTAPAEITLMTDLPETMPRFVFCVCQHGAENVCKREVLARNPFLSFAFSRPGFLTFKVVEGTELPETFELKTPFARTSGWSLGRLDRADAESSRQELVERIIASSATCVHIWQRDPTMPGEDGFEPGRSVLAAALAETIKTAFVENAARNQASQRQAVHPVIRINEAAEHGERVFDVILVEPDSWWFGWHLAYSVPRRWPGGTPIFDLSKPVISRAYWKLAEGLLWSRLQFKPGHWCVELGAAPGGACQLLLEQGMKVIAVDPAELDDSIKSSSNLYHMRCRSREVRRARLKHVRWLMADLNVAPNYTLDTVGDIVTHPKIQIQGMLLTLKMMSWDLADEIPNFIVRVREWGFQTVHVRQLAFSRREVCLMALKE